MADPVAMEAVVTALAGSLLVSYTRARGESLGVLCKLGVMQRERNVVIAREREHRRVFEEGVRISDKAIASAATNAADRPIGRRSNGQST